MPSIPSLVAVPVAVLSLTLIALDLLARWDGYARRRELERWLGEQRLAWARVPASVPPLRRP
jgi:hypothetical protein